MGWEPNDKGASLSMNTFYFDFAIMQINKSFGYGKPQSSGGFSTSGPGTQDLESAEYFRFIILRKTRTLVFDFYYNKRFIPAG